MTIKRQAGRRNHPRSENSAVLYLVTFVSILSSFNTTARNHIMEAGDLADHLESDFKNEAEILKS